MSDQNTSVQVLKDILRKFRDEREWKQFHTPKNLAQAISIEANELLEEFLWKTDEDVETLFQDEAFRQRVEFELADILAFCLNFANSTGIDLTAALVKKMEHNRSKYPVEKSKNTAKKYTEL